MDIVYLDNSATTKPYKEVVDEVAECMEKYYANPSSSHRLGFEAEKKIKTARERVARLINAQPQQIIFTSGGSEANNTAIRGVLHAGDNVIISNIEHPSVMKTVEALENLNIEVSIISVDNRGIINLRELEESIKPNTKLVSIMHVNNEIGSIQPLDEISQIVRAKNKRTRIHIDMVQSAGKINIDVKKTDIDMASISAHKIHGPKGVGALYVKDRITISPIISGGGQEMDIRSGTENVPGISGFGVAAQMAKMSAETSKQRVKCLKEHFLEGLEYIDGIVINSPADEFHIDNILNVSFMGVKGEVLLHALEDYNIFVSTGSACSAKKASHKNYVLPAIGLSENEVNGAIRFSFSHMNTKDEIDYTLDALKKALAFLRRIKK